MGGHAISLKEKRKMTENVIWQPNKVSAKDRYRVLGQNGVYCVPDDEATHAKSRTVSSLFHSDFYHRDNFLPPE